MDLRQRIEQSKKALRHEDAPRAAYDVTADMDQDAMKRFIDYLMEQKREDDLEKRAMRSVLEELSGNFNDISDKLGKALDELRTVKSELKAANKKALKYEELYKRERQNRFGNRQKNTPSKKSHRNDGSDNNGDAGMNGSSAHDIPDREQERENNDGTDNCVTPENGTGTDNGNSSALTSKQNADQSNRPPKYNVLDAKCQTADHPCDTTGLDEVLDRRFLTLFGLKTVLTADNYEFVKIRKYVTDPETGKKKRTTAWVYRPCPGHPQQIPMVEGTHATPEFLQALAYEVYLKGTTLGNLHKWLTDLGMSISKTTLNSWLRKGKRKLDKIITFIKEMAVEKDSVVNCDETWCKVRRFDKYRKCYLWVLVNREKRIVIFFYDNGSRGSRVLMDFLGEAEIKCLVSDGYVGYKFLGKDKGLQHWGCIEHAVDWAHIRAKILEAIESGCDDPIAWKLLEYINKLFKLEDQYREKRLSPEQITKRRQSPETLEIINRMYAELLVAINTEDPYRSPLLDTALRYMYNNWDNALTYLKDGRYPIDNNAAERSVRPFCARRNSFEHFGSDAGAEMAACYHSIIGTLKAWGISAWHGLGKLFTEVIDSFDDFLRVMNDSKSFSPA